MALGNHLSCVEAAGKARASGLRVALGDKAANELAVRCVQMCVRS